MKKTHEKLGLIIALTLGASAVANGAVVYNNLPANLDATVPGTSQTFRDSLDGSAGSLTNSGFVASQFIMNSTDCQSALGCAVDITLRLSSTFNTILNPNADGYQLQIFGNGIAQNVSNVAAGTQGPEAAPVGVALRTLTNPGPFPFNDSEGSNYTFTTAGLQLTSNIPYWVKLSPTVNVDGSGESITWFGLTDPAAIAAAQAVAGQPAKVFADIGGLYTWSSPNLLMKVVATPSAGEPVPVPGAIWLMGSALLGLVTSWRRKLGQ